MCLRRQVFHTCVLHFLFSYVDDVLVSYIADVLCELGEGAEDEGSFDVEQFSEMISAYVPEFAAVER